MMRICYAPLRRQRYRQQKQPSREMWRVHFLGRRKPLLKLYVRCSPMPWKCFPRCQWHVPAMPRASTQVNPCMIQPQTASFHDALLWLISGGMPPSWRPYHAGERSLEAVLMKPTSSPPSSLRGASAPALRLLAHCRTAESADDHQ